MLALPDLQKSFARAVLGGTPDPLLAALILPDVARLDVHRNTARSVAIEALRLHFPATEAIVGAAFFGHAAGRFWRAHPPGAAWLGAWGGGFAAYLARLRAAAGVAYLADVARFEWALCRAAIAADAVPLSLDALRAVPAGQQAALRFTPHPSLSLLRLRYPADAIADAVLAGDDAAMAAIDLAAGPVHLLIGRFAHGVAAERLAPSAWRFLHRLFAGETLGTLLASSGRLDAASLLATQLAGGRLIACRIAETAPCAA